MGVAVAKAQDCYCQGEVPVLMGGFWNVTKASVEACQIFEPESTEAALCMQVGAALSMVYTSGAPIMFVGCGQTYVDLKRLNTKSVVRSLLK